ncbi:MAG: AMP-binding protein [Candidatus Dormibacterales bacterium]
MNAEFIAARDLLLRLRDDTDGARTQFAWPRPERFNWALDYFDGVAEGNQERALWVLDEDGTEHIRTFEDMRRRSNQVANHLRSLGVGRGDRILLMLGNVVPLWEVMLAAIKLGAVVIPATTLLGRDDIIDRLERGRVRAVVAASSAAPRFEGLGGGELRISVGGTAQGWGAFEDADRASDRFDAQGITQGGDPLLLYFTSGTTSKPKLVEHTHISYPIGHLSTMYWLGLKPGDVHLNISSPGWAKHAWSNFFAPWNAPATVVVANYSRFSAETLLGVITRCSVTTLCAPPTVWRMLIQADLTKHRVGLREAVSAGEPLNPEVIEQVRRAWGITIRDGYGQTETTAQIGNAPGQPLKLGSMGRPLPGYEIVLAAPDGSAGDEGEICIPLDRRPVGLMAGYRDDPERTAEATRHGLYHTGDVATRDADGYITYVGRADDVFKASDYRISPFELESVLIEHPAVAEAAVVPSPDPVRTAVPKAFVILVAGQQPSRELAGDILAFCRTRLSPFKRVRRLEFSDLPKTISGKIRRVELRGAEAQRPAGGARRPDEYWEEDFPELKA